jgi:hypothetical protein
MKEFLDNEELRNIQSEGRDSRASFLPDISIVDYVSLVSNKKYNIEEKKNLHNAMDRISAMMDEHFVHIVMNDHIHIPVKDHLGNIVKYYNVKVGGSIYNQLEKMFGKNIPRYLEEIKFYCDDQRHLVCVPYSIENLHFMAKFLDIDKCWFHNKNKPGRNRSHYDIPKKRIKEIMNQCEIVSGEDIVNICKGEYIKNID